MSLTTGLLILVVLVIGVVLLKRRSAAGTEQAGERRKPVSQQSTQYHAVSIKFTSDACEAARAMKGRRFLSTAAPRLPLDDCDVEVCNCRFVHHKDRRSGDDRRDPWGQAFGSGAASGSYEEERRKNPERRNEPPEDSF